MTKKSRKDTVVEAVDADLRLLRETYESGKKDPLMYYKGLVCVAYRLASVEATIRALDVLLQIPQSQLVSLLDSEAKQDKFFSGLAYDLAGLLTKQGAISTVADPADIRPTQSEGVA